MTRGCNRAEGGEAFSLTWKSCFIDAFKSLVNLVLELPKGLFGGQKEERDHEPSSTQLPMPPPWVEPEPDETLILRLVFELGDFLIFIIAFGLLTFFLRLPFFLFPFLLSAWTRHISIRMDRPKGYGKCFELAIRPAVIGFFFGVICWFFLVPAFPTLVAMPIITEVVLYEVALFIALVTQMRYVATNVFGGLPLVSWNRCILSATKSLVVGLTSNLLWAVPLFLLYFANANYVLPNLDLLLILYKLVFLLFFRFFVFGAAAIRFSVEEIGEASKILKSNQ